MEANASRVTTNEVFRLLQNPLGEKAQADRALAVDCARHARMVFNNPDFDLDHAVPGTLTLNPTPAMLEPLERDYDAMAGMIVGAVPVFPGVVESISVLEARLNGSV